jgi:cell division protease FtsH
MSLGVTFSAPEGDRFNFEYRELLAKIDVALGGRVAEEIVFDEITTGAESDIQQLTAIARNMVGRWGMSTAVGPLAVIPRDGTGPLLPGAAEMSEHTQQLIDEEVRRIVDESHRRVVALIEGNRGKLDSLAQALLEHETLDEDDAYAAAGVERSQARDGPKAREVAAAAAARVSSPAP